MTKTINNDNYIKIYGFMLNDLKLKGNELIIYACIYGFIKTTGKPFNSKLHYLEQWTNCSKQSVIECLNSLVKKGYLVKFKSSQKNISYFISIAKESLPIMVKKLDQQGKESLPILVKKVYQQGKESLPSYIRYNNDIINDKIYDTNSIVNQSSINELISVLPNLNIDCEIDPNINYNLLANKVKESDYLINFKSLKQLHNNYDKIINDNYKRWSSEFSKKNEPSQTRQTLALERNYTAEELDELIDSNNFDF